MKKIANISILITMIAVVIVLVANQITKPKKLEVPKEIVSPQCDHTNKKPF